MTDPALFPDEREARELPPEVFTQEEVRELLNACNDTPFGRRLRALVALLYRTGIEISEALLLRLDDVNLTEGAGAIRVTPTRLLPRTLALEDPLCRLLGDWLVVRSGLPGDHLFCNIRGPGRGQPWAVADVRRQFRDLGDVIGRRVNAGSFRLTLIAELVTEQWPLSYIQTQLGLQNVWSLRFLFPRLGIEPAPETEVAEIGRARPPWSDDRSLLPMTPSSLDPATAGRLTVRPAAVLRFDSPD